ncbi:MAG TPA: hypothetical protein VGN49_15235 [Micrococcaceae bacterium]|jgi:hypothetical protein|nr:hypothetical protein [Micrococcaceae bacterium]
MSSFKPPPWTTPADRPDDENYARVLSRQAKRGELCRVRRGLYLPTSVWRGLEPWQQYAVRIDAVHRTAHGDPIFCQRSAAQLWGIPVIEIPDFVDMLVSQEGGGRSTADVRRHRSDLSEVRTVRIRGLRATTKLQTVRDLAVVLPFPDAVAAMDRVLSPLNLPVERASTPLQKPQVAASLKLLPYASQQRRVQRVLDFADGRSGSPGESLSRAHIFRLGLPIPALQHEIRDGQGRIGYADFYWKESGLVGEFDGWVKYSRGEFLAGELPSEVLRREKVREDRIRATGLRVVRWMWSEARKPELLRQKLIRAGLKPL